MQPYLEVGGLQLACQGGQKGALARPWGAQQQGHAARGNDGTHAVKDAKVLSGRLYQLQPQQQALQQLLWYCTKVHHQWPCYHHYHHDNKRTLCGMRP